MSWGVLWMGWGAGRNLHINVHSTKQWNSMSMPSVNELSFLFPKNHSLHLLAQAWTTISQTLSVPSEVHPWGERLSFSCKQLHCKWRPRRLPGGSGKLSWWKSFTAPSHSPTPGSLTTSCPRAPLPSSSGPLERLNKAKPYYETQLNSKARKLGPCSSAYCAYTHGTGFA